MVFRSFRCLDMKKRRRLFSKSAAFAGAQKAGDALLTSPALCVVVHLFVPPRFPLPLKTLILLGFSMFSYGNALKGRGLFL